jgi:hypothetical protein
MSYLSYASEDDYHAHYTLAAMLERETNRAERKAIRADIRGIIQRRKMLAEKSA